MIFNKLNYSKQHISFSYLLGGKISNSLNKMAKRKLKLLQTKKTVSIWFFKNQIFTTVFNFFQKVV